MLSATQQIILGIVQGITEWLPISSSGALVLVMTNFFNITDLQDLITTALFFHLGTFFAALIYFRREATQIFKTIFKYKFSDERNKKTLKFLFFSTLISGAVGIVILKTIENFDSLNLTGKAISFLIGIFLLFTGILQIKSKKSGTKNERDLKINDGLFLGIAQGLSVLPGISRSGITVSSLLLKKFNETTALKISFLMSLPIILIANIILNFEDLVFTTTALYGLLTSFVFGILTIHILMKLSKKINFGWFVLIFALLMMGSVLI